MREIKRMLIHWKKAMFSKMVVLDSELALQNGVFVEEFDKLIYNVGKKEKEINEQWKETCDVMSNPEIIKGLEKSIQDFKEGKYYILTKNKGNLILTRPNKNENKI